MRGQRKGSRDKWVRSGLSLNAPSAFHLEHPLGEHLLASALLASHQANGLSFNT
jgi:hypothetical protein